MPDAVMRQVTGPMTASSVLLPVADRFGRKDKVTRQQTPHPASLKLNRHESCKMSRQVSAPQHSPIPSIAFGSSMVTSPPAASPWSSPNMSPMGSPRKSITPRGVGTFDFDELHLDGAAFDPMQQPLKGQLLHKMRVQPHALIE